jgi:hypothetical protein
LNAKVLLISLLLIKRVAVLYLRLIKSLTYRGKYFHFRGLGKKKAGKC